MADGSRYADWIAVDWGTSHLRAWAMDASGQILDAATSDRGMGTLDATDYEPALKELIAPWMGAGALPVLACGMVGSRQGWVEAPYASAPCEPISKDPGRPCVTDSRLDVRVVPGVRQDSPADVMRGEETQIAGFLAGNPEFDGVLCLPGTHTKWVRISAGEIVSFQTFMTGELFATLGDHTVLRHSVAGDDWDDDAFTTAISDSLSRPEGLGARLFSIRAEGLLHGEASGSARARLSGYLIGAELAAARPYWLGQEVALIGAPALCALYQSALSAQGVAATSHDAEPMTLAGLGAARASFFGD